MEKTGTILTQTRLPLMEAFYTIQGEGFHQGRAAYFIRLAGCDVGCVWCDVKASWDASAWPEVEVGDIVEKAAGYPADIAVITGGEPLMHDMTFLTETLRDKGFKSHIETSGAHPLTGNFDWICLSPKKFKYPLPEIYPFVDELKIIIYNKSDFKWAESFAELMPAGSHLLLQPEWDVSDKMMPQIVDYVKANPEWRISLQTHKYMNVP